MQSCFFGRLTFYSAHLGIVDQQDGIAYSDTNRHDRAHKRFYVEGGACQVKHDKDTAND
ncbi:MAG: hypothetical protein BWY75_01964 [bacterium ADurb.Bin425]|nr:MAG: hypothetical protein BWY75_01964 [bacterium ADurb.Bin425]